MRFQQAFRKGLLPMLTFLEAFLVPPHVDTVSLVREVVVQLLGEILVGSYTVGDEDLNALSGLQDALFLSAEPVEQVAEKDHEEAAEACGDYGR